MNANVIVFWTLAVLAVGSALVATYAKNTVNAAYALFFALLAIAGVYVYLGADFLAITQVVVYVGGILVLLLFGILLTNRNLEFIVLGGRRSYVVGTILGAGLLALVVAILQLATWHNSPTPVTPGTTTAMGYMLLKNYLLAFEFSSLTLLAALIGAAYLVRGRDKD